MARYKSSPGSSTVGIAEIAQITSRHTNRCLYTTPGSYTYTVPSGVTSILAVAVGPGSKPVEGLKCVDLLTCGVLNTGIRNMYLQCCCSTCILSCCTPPVCYANSCTAGSARAANTGAYTGGIVDPSPGANTVPGEIRNQSSAPGLGQGGCIAGYRLTSYMRHWCFDYCSMNGEFRGSNNWSCGSPQCNFCAACAIVCKTQDVEYFFTKAPGFGGGYSEKTMTVVPAQSVNVVVGCWNCNNSFSCVTANSTVHICATGPKVCRRQLPMVKGPFLGVDTVTGQCYWEECLANRPVTTICNCSNNQSCCGGVMKCLSHTGVHTWKNDYGFVTRSGQGYNGDINRAGGGTVITYSGSFNHMGRTKTAASACKITSTCEQEGGVGCWCVTQADVTRGASGGTDACICCLQPGFGTGGGAENVLLCTSPTAGTFGGWKTGCRQALTTCLYEFFAKDYRTGYDCGATCNRGTFKLFGNGNCCICIWCSRVQGHLCHNMKHYSWQRPMLGNTLCTNTFSSTVQRVANTPGFINQHDICGCGHCCINNRYFHKGTAQYGSMCGSSVFGFEKLHSDINYRVNCGGSCMNCCLYPRGHTKILNTIADECFKFGGSSAGNHYGDGVSAISDATYGVCSPLVYGCDDAVTNPGADGARAYNCLHPVLCREWNCNCNNPICAYGGKYRTAGAQDFIGTGNVSFEALTLQGCSGFDIPFASFFCCGRCVCQQGSGCCTFNQVGYKYNFWLYPWSVYGIEDNCSMCDSACGTGNIQPGGLCKSDRMAGYHFWFTCYCNCDMAIENDIWFPYAISGDNAGGILGNPLLDLKGADARWSTGEIIPVMFNDARSRCCTITGQACGSGACCSHMWRQFAEGCQTICEPAGCHPPRPHVCSCYRYRSQIIHTGECIRIATNATGAEYANFCRSSNNYVQTCPCNNGCAHSHTLMDIAYNYGKCAPLSMSNNDCAVWSYDCKCFCWDAAGTCTNAHCWCACEIIVPCQGVYCNGHVYWPEKINYDIFSANTISSDFFDNGNTTVFRRNSGCSVNHNPTMDVYSMLCVWQTWYGDESDDSYPDNNPGHGDNSTYCSRPETAWASAAFNPNCYQSNAQVQLVLDPRLCKEALAWQYIGPWSHRIISLGMHGFCCYTSTHYNANVLTCPFRSPDRVTVYDADFYNQFVFGWENRHYYKQICYCRAQQCQCCGSPDLWQMQEIKPTACVIRCVGTACTDIDTLTAQGGAGTATPGVWNSCCGGDGGVITSVTVTCGGQDYTEVPFICATGGGGTGFIGKPILTPTCTNYCCCVGTTGLHVRDEVTGGSVTGVEVVCGGTGYTSAPTLRVCGGSGSGATITAVVSDFTSNKSFGSGGGTITGTLYNAKCIKVTDSAAVQSVTLGRGGRGCEPEAPAYFNSYPGISTTITNPTDPSEAAFDQVTGCSWFDTRQILGSGGNGCFTSGVFGIVNAQNPGPGGGGGVGCDVLGNLIGCGGVLAGGSGCCGDGGAGGGAGKCGTPGNGMVVIYWTPS